MLIVDETGDRKDGDKTAHVGRQYLGNRGKIENGVVTVGSLWADEGVYYPLAVEPYTPGALVRRAARPTPPFAPNRRSRWSWSIRRGPRVALPRGGGRLPVWRAPRLHARAGQRGVPYVVALQALPCLVGAGRGDRGGVGGGGAGRLGQPRAAGRLGAGGAALSRRASPTTWWALEGEAGPYGPDRARRLVIATPDPATLPGAGDLVPGDDAAAADADLAEVVRLYGLRNWVEQQYKQVKHSLGWSQYQVRSDRAIRRHWALVQCAFAFCWWAESHAPPTAATAGPRQRADRATPPGERGEKAAAGIRSLAPAVALLAAWRCGGCGPGWSRRCSCGAAGAPGATSRPPPPLQALLDWLHQGHPLILYDSS